MTNERTGIVEGSGRLLNNLSDVHLGGKTGKLV